MVDPRNFLMNTDYPIDKIIYVKSGSFVDNGLPYSFVHNLPFTPLVWGYWSTTSDFSTHYEFYSGIFPTANPSYLYSLEVQIESSSTIIRMVPVLGGALSTIYYRIFAFQPYGDSNSLNGTSNTGDRFVINTDYNYMKLVSSGSYNLGTATSYTVTHNLGYKPRVMSWFSSPVYSGDTIPLVYGGNYVTPVVTDTQLVFNNPTGTNITTLHWRIYADI